MKLFLITQTVVDNYDTYDSAVVAAENETAARDMHPSSGDSLAAADDLDDSWVRNAEDVTAKYLGEAAPGIEKGVVCASFNAG
jgi:hypothetical protein